jgi:hypothetical protein
MKRLALVAMLASVSPVSAQIPNLWEGEAMVGLAGQNDTQKADRVKLSRVGISVGFIVQPIFSTRNLSLSNQLSFYPIATTDKPAPFDTQPPPPTHPLIINTAWARLGTSEPEATGRFVYFIGAGLGVSVATPREGKRIQPMAGVGIRRWFSRQLGFEISFQCTQRELGKTSCQLPVTSVWPFHGAASAER